MKRQHRVGRCARRTLAYGLAAILFTAAPRATQVATGASPFNFTKVVDTTTAVVGETPTVTYSFFGRPAINQGNVAYRAAYTDVSSTLRHQVDRVTPAGALVLVQKANPAGPIKGIISDPTIYGTSVAYSALLTGSQNTGAFYTLGASQVTDGLNNEQAPSIYNGQVAYPRRSITTGSGPNNIHIARTSNGISSSTILVDHNTLVPGAGGPFFGQYDAYADSSLNGVNNAGAVAFMGVWSNNINNNGIYRWDESTGQVTVIADPNTPIPGQAGNFTTSTLPFRTPNSGFNNAVGNSFSFPQSFYTSSSLDVSSRVSIYGKAVSLNYDDGPRSGVYYKIAGPLNKIADQNTPHPMAAGNFKDFLETSTIGGQTAFTATDAAGNRGLFLTLCGSIVQVAAPGTVIDGKTVAGVDLGHRGLGVKNGSKLQSGLELAFYVSFTNGQQAIYKTTASTLCVSPAVVIGAGTPSGFTAVFGAPSVTSPVFDDLTSVLRVEISALDSGGAPAVLGGSSAADLLGIDSLPGNNPSLIDYVTGAGGVAPETMAVRFNQPVLVEGLHLDGFDANDSAVLHIGGQTIAVSGATNPDGMIPLPGLTLLQGETVTIGWDPTNSTGDGFSFAGMAITPVPEPGGAALAIALAALSAVVRPWRRVVTSRSVTAPA